MTRLHVVEGKIRFKGDRKAKWHEINVCKSKTYAEKVARKYLKYYGKGKVRVRAITWPPLRSRKTKKRK